MWSELMIDDADALAFEIDHLIESLGAYSRALKDRDQRYLENQLRGVFGLEGTPIRLTIRQKGDKED